MYLKSIIRQMFNGEIRREKIKPTEEYEKILEKLNEKETELRKRLKDFPELLSLYDAVEEETGLLYAESEDNYYAAGFKSGLFLGLEAAGDNTKED